jgi:pimeloyl-ACP methyl ester carboxylesterase
MTSTVSSRPTSGAGSGPRRRGCLFFTGRGLKWLSIGILAILALGFAYQTIATEMDKRGYPPPGQMVNVNGHMMHITCTGQGSPTIILEAGAFSFSTEWYWVQQQLATTNRVCSYDRAGNGWSEPVPGLRDGLNIVRELHSLLQAAKVPGPYVMVGHSLGGVTNPIYAAQYPDDVVGMVLVDSAVPIGLVLPDTNTVERYIADNQSAYMLMSGLVRFGAARFIISNEFRGYGYPSEAATRLTAFKSTVQAVDTWDAEVRLAQAELGQQAKAAQDLGARPLIVLWAGHPEITKPEDRAKLKSIWEKVAVFSSNSATRIIDGADHGSIIGNEQYAAQVSAAVREVIASVRTGQPLAK